MKKHKQTLAQVEELIQGDERRMAALSKLERATDAKVHSDRLRQMEEESRWAEQQTKSLLNGNQPLLTGSGGFYSQFSTPFAATFAASSSFRPSSCAAMDLNPPPPVAMVWEGWNGFDENQFTKHPQQRDFTGAGDAIQSALAAQLKSTPGGPPGDDSRAAASSHCFEEFSSNDTEMPMEMLTSNDQSDAVEAMDTAEKSVLVIFCDRRDEILERYVNGEDVLLGWEGRRIEVHFSIHPYALGTGYGPLGVDESRRFDYIVSYLPHTTCPGGDIGKVVENSLRLLKKSGEIHLALSTETSAVAPQKFFGYNHQLIDSVDNGVTTYSLQPTICVPASISDVASTGSVSSITLSGSSIISFSEAIDLNRKNCREQTSLNARILVSTITDGVDNRVLYDVLQVPLKPYILYSPTLLLSDAQAYYPTEGPLLLAFSDRCTPKNKHNHTL